MPTYRSLKTPIGDWGLNPPKPKSHVFTITPPGKREASKGRPAEETTTFVDTSPPKIKDKESFTKIRQSGAIKMTPHSVSSVVVKRLNAAVTKDVVRGSSSMELGPKPGAAWWYTQKPYQWFPVTEQGDLAYWRSRYPGGSYISIDTIDWEKVDRLKRLSITACVAESFSSIDVGTELAELPELAKYIVGLVRNAIPALRELKRLARNPKSYASAWLQYRYAIMPVIYTIQDLKDLLQHHKDVYKTTRVKKSIGDFTNTKHYAPSQSSSPVNFNRTIEGAIHVSATGKARYKPETLLMLTEQLEINAFKTGWELLPYSFVADWFINVGDYLSAVFGSVGDRSVERAFCVAIKASYVEATNIVVDTRERMHFTASDVNRQVVRSETEVRGASNVTVPVETRHVNSYVRELFTPNDISLALDNTALSWRRKADALALLISPLNKALRRLA